MTLSHAFDADDSPERPKVLLVDDDEVTLMLTAEALRERGFEITEANSGEQALAMLADWTPDIIVLDAMMPGLDGFEALEALRSLPAWCETPVFVWTSMILSDEDYARLAGSARAILAKGDGALAGLLDALSRWRPKVHP